MGATTQHKARLLLQNRSKPQIELVNLARLAKLGRWAVGIE